MSTGATPDPVSGGDEPTDQWSWSGPRADIAGAAGFSRGASLLPGHRCRPAQQSTRKLGFAADWRHLYRERRPGPRACQLGVARLGSPLGGFDAAAAQTECKEKRHLNNANGAFGRHFLVRTLSFAIRGCAAGPGSQTDGRPLEPGGIRALTGNTISPGCRRRRSE